jgi:hypothetical protein
MPERIRICEKYHFDSGGNELFSSANRPASTRSLNRIELKDCAGIVRANENPRNSFAPNLVGNPLGRLDDQPSLGS